MKEMKWQDNTGKTDTLFQPTHDICGDVVVYSDDRYVLGQKDGEPYFVADGKMYSLSCHPYEPCTCIKNGGVLVAVIHNAFDPSAVLKAFAKGKTVDSISSKVYEAKEFCEMLAFAANNLYDTDISYVEGAMAVERLKAMGAVTPETAVDVRELGVRKISDRFSHSKKLDGRVMYTEEGMVYVRIKKRPF